MKNLKIPNHAEILTIYSFQKPTNPIHPFLLLCRPITLVLLFSSTNVLSIKLVVLTNIPPSSGYFKCAGQASISSVKHFIALAYFSLLFWRIIR